MQVWRSLPTETVKPSVLALGNFDGVHIGHRRLLESGLDKAQSLGLNMSVLVFDPHPLKVLFPEQNINLLTTQEERLALFEQIGIDTVYLLPFSREVASMSPEKFIQDILLRLGTAHVVVGFNYSFGYQGKGTPEELMKLGQKYGFTVSVLQAQTINGKVISSSSIRQALLQGDIILAKTMLGRPPCLCGTVVKGEQRGRTLGYPTANLAFSEDLLIPKRGVYAIWADIDGAIRLGMMNIGLKPTFHAEFSTSVEVHFFDFNKNLYGKRIVVHIEERLRDERKFASIRELCEQLERDAIHARRILKQAL